MHDVFFEWQPQLGLTQQVTPCPQDSNEILILHQMAQAVRTEVLYREALSRHCDWYAAIAHDHQVDLAKMRTEPQLLRWGLRHRPSQLFP